ncbi:MAG: hypothetical protein ACYDDA_03850 [Acidiferrobacteraceae bacterium]
MPFEAVQASAMNTMGTINEGAVRIVAEKSGSGDVIRYRVDRVTQALWRKVGFYRSLRRAIAVAKSNQTKASEYVIGYFLETGEFNGFGQKLGKDWRRWSRGENSAK